MKLAAAIWIALLVGWLAWLALTYEADLNRRDAQVGALYARVDSLEAYVADLWVRTDRLEVLEGL